jgi:hypothetical protein
MKERIYNNESPEEFGLKADSRILIYSSGKRDWDLYAFYVLRKGELWRKLPKIKTPKEERPI